MDGAATANPTIIFDIVVRDSKVLLASYAA
jgi:hypothetical protein